MAQRRSSTTRPITATSLMAQRRGAPPRPSRHRAGRCHGLLDGGADRGSDARHHRARSRRVLVLGGSAIHLVDGSACRARSPTALEAPSLAGRARARSAAACSAALPSGPAATCGRSPPASAATPDAVGRGCSAQIRRPDADRRRHARRDRGLGRARSRHSCRAPSLGRFPDRDHSRAVGDTAFKAAVTGLPRTRRRLDARPETTIARRAGSCAY